MARQADGAGQAGGRVGAPWASGARLPGSQPICGRIELVYLRARSALLLLVYALARLLRAHTPKESIRTTKSKRKRSYLCDIIKNKLSKLFMP